MDSARVVEPNPNIKLMRQMLNEMMDKGPVNIPAEEQEECKEMIRNHFIEKKSRGQGLAS